MALDPQTVITVLEYVDSNPDTTVEEVSYRTAIRGRLVKQALDALIQSGLVTEWVHNGTPRYQVSESGPEETVFTPDAR